MRKFQRLPSPAFLTQKWEQWGLEWEQRLNAGAGASFHWHELDREPVNHKLLPVLKEQVQDHCSFCDVFPVSPPSNPTIEHFRPKRRFPREAYRWENLYYCCDHCQQRGDDFDEAMLRPDGDDYSFERYFRWDFTTGTLEVNEQATPEDQNRAEKTRQAYRLNIGHPLLRRQASYRRSRMPDEPLDSFPYRDFVEPLERVAD